MKTKWWRRFTRKPDEKPGTYVADIEWQRVEELRPDRLGPGPDDVEEPEVVRDPFRPLRTLGPLPNK